MQTNPLNIPPVAIDRVKAALLSQYADSRLRRRATMLWGSRGVGKSSVVQQVAQELDIELIDLRLTTIEPVDLRGALFADEERQQTVWFPPEFLPADSQSAGILFLDELTAADQRLQISAYSLILDRRVGHYRLPDGWMVVAAGNAAFHGAVSYDMGTALADRLFHFNVQSVVQAFAAHALRQGFAPEVMAYLQIRPDKLDDTAAQLAQDHLLGASPRGWEDVSQVLGSAMGDADKRLFVQGRIGAANAADFFGALAELSAGANVSALLDASPGADTAALLPTSIDALYGLVYGLVAAANTEQRMTRALEVAGQFDDMPGQLPVAEARTLAMELLMQGALERGLEGAVINSRAFAAYSDQRSGLST